MNKEDEVLKKVSEIFKRELADNSLKIELSTSAADIEKWDSINNLVIISAIEEEFNIVFPIEVIFDARNVGDFCDYVVKYSNKI